MNCSYSIHQNMLQSITTSKSISVSNTTTDKEYATNNNELVSTTNIDITPDSVGKCIVYRSNL